MTAVPGGDLGIFTTAELQLTGINRRGILQPLLPEPGGGTRDEAGRDGDQPGDRVGDRGGHEAGAAVLQGLVDRGLLVPSGDRWRPAGALEVVLVTAATAGSVVAHHPHEGDAARLLLGAAGGWPPSPSPTGSKPPPAGRRTDRSCNSGAPWRWHRSQGRGSCSAGVRVTSGRWPPLPPDPAGWRA